MRSSSKPVSSFYPIFIGVFSNSKQEKSLFRITFLKSRKNKTLSLAEEGAIIQGEALNSS